MTTESTTKAPEQLFAVVGDNGAVWATFDARDKAERYPGPRMLEMAPRTIVKYLRAALSPEPETSGEAWRQWFDRVGQHATVDVVNATANLVIAEREIATPPVAADAEEVAKQIVDHLPTRPKVCSVCHDPKCNNGWGGAMFLHERAFTFNEAKAALTAAADKQREVDVKRAFDSVQAIEGSEYNYSALQKAASVAAAIRAGKKE